MLNQKRSFTPLECLALQCGDEKKKVPSLKRRPCALARRFPTGFTLIALFSLLFLPAHGNAGLYSTWEGIEADKCASSWLITRFLDKEAEFKLFPRGTAITEGIPFDTPDAQLRRQRGLTTFDCVLKKYEIKDNTLDRIAIIIRDIEINIWGKKATEEAIVLNMIIRGLDIITEDDLECLKKSWIIFDALYAVLGSKVE